MNRFDPDTDAKVQASIRFLNETIQCNANEPSLAFYRIQEHAHKTLPLLVQKRNELNNIENQSNGLIFDIQYSVDAVKNLGKSDENINNVITNLEKALYVSKQINLLRQQQVQQQLFEKKTGPLLSSLKNS